MALFFLSTPLNEQIFYIIFGSALLITNLFICLAVAASRNLRKAKEYVFLAGFSLAQAGLGYATLSAAIYRLWLLNTDQYTVPVTRLSCVATPHLLALTFSMAFEACAMLAMSTDRFLAIKRPLDYRTYTMNYVIYIMLACSLPALAYTIWAAGRLLWFHGELANVAAKCLFSAWDPNTNMIMYIWRGTLSALSIAVYVVVVYLFRKKTTAISDSQHHMAEKNAKKQKQLTISVGISCLFRVLLTTIPSCIMLKWKLTGDTAGPKGWGVIFWIMHCANAMTSLFIYTARHKEIREGIMAALSCGKVKPTQDTVAMVSVASKAKSATPKPNNVTYHA